MAYVAGMKVWLGVDLGGQGVSPEMDGHIQGLSRVYLSVKEAKQALIVRFVNFPLSNATRT